MYVEICNHIFINTGDMQGFRHSNLEYVRDMEKQLDFIIISIRDMMGYVIIFL